MCDTFIAGRGTGTAGSLVLGFCCTEPGLTPELEHQVVKNKTALMSPNYCSWLYPN